VGTIVVTIVVDGTTVVVGNITVVVGNTCEVSVAKVVTFTKVNTSMLVTLGEVITNEDITIDVMSLNTGRVVVGTSITLELMFTIFVVGIIAVVNNVGVGEVMSVTLVSPILTVVEFMTSLTTSEGVKTLNTGNVVVGTIISLLSCSIVVNTAEMLTLVIVGSMVDGISVVTLNTSLCVGMMTGEEMMLLVTGSTLGTVNTDSVLVGTISVVSTDGMGKMDEGG